MRIRILLLLILLILCSSGAYLAYPHLKKLQTKKTDTTPPAVASFSPIPNIPLLSTVSEEKIIGSWVLSPRSTKLSSASLGTSGRRSGLSLESWGGGEANFVLAGRTIKGPIAWHSKPGRGPGEPATLHINAAKEKFTLRFSMMGSRLTLVSEKNSPESGEKDFLRFLKVS